MMRIVPTAPTAPPAAPAEHAACPPCPPDLHAPRAHSALHPWLRASNGSKRRTPSQFSLCCASLGAAALVHLGLPPCVSRWRPDGPNSMDMGIHMGCPAPTPLSTHEPGKQLAADRSKRQCPCSVPPSSPFSLEHCALDLLTWPQQRVSLSGAHPAS